MTRKKEEMIQVCSLCGREALELGPGDYNEWNCEHYKDPSAQIIWVPESELRVPEE